MSYLNSLLLASFAHMRGEGYYRPSSSLFASSLQEKIFLLTLNTPQARIETIECNFSISADRLNEIQDRILPPMRDMRINKNAFEAVLVDVQSISEALNDPIVKKLEPKHSLNNLSVKKLEPKHSLNNLSVKKLEPKHIFALLCSWAACYCLLSRFSMLPTSIAMRPALYPGLMGVALDCLAEINGPETRAILGGYQHQYLNESGSLAQLKGRAIQVALVPLRCTGKIRDLCYNYIAGQNINSAR